MFLVNPSKLTTLPFVVFSFDANRRDSRTGVLGQHFFRRKMAFHLAWDVTAQWLLSRGETLLIQMLGNHTSRRAQVDNKTCSIQRLSSSIIYYYFFYTSKNRQVRL